MVTVAKIIKFPPPKDPFKEQKVKAVFADYAPAANCCNDDSFGCLCIKCGMCGREFIDGILQKGDAGE